MSNLKRHIRCLLGMGYIFLCIFILFAFIAWVNNNPNCTSYTALLNLDDFFSISSIPECNLSINKEGGQ